MTRTPPCSSTDEEEEKHISLWKLTGPAAQGSEKMYRQRAGEMGQVVCINPLMLKSSYRRLSSGSMILLMITLELRMILKNI